MTYYIVPILYILLTFTARYFATRKTSTVSPVSSLSHTESDLPNNQPLGNNTYSVITTSPTLIPVHITPPSCTCLLLSPPKPVITITDVLATPDYFTMPYTELKAVAKANGIKCKGREYILTALRQLSHIK